MTLSVAGFGAGSSWESPSPDRDFGLQLLRGNRCPLGKAVRPGVRCRGQAAGAGAVPSLRSASAGDTRVLSPELISKLTESNVISVRQQRGQREAQADGAGGRRVPGVTAVVTVAMGRPAGGSAHARGPHSVAALPRRGGGGVNSWRGPRPSSGTKLFAGRAVPSPGRRGHSVHPAPPMRQARPPGGAAALRSLPLRWDPSASRDTWLGDSTSGRHPPTSPASPRWQLRHVGPQFSAGRRWKTLGSLPQS